MHEGFKKLKEKLSHKGVKDAAGLSAYIGRKKFGKKKFDKAAAEGKSMEHMKPLKGK